MRLAVRVLAIAAILLLGSAVNAETLTYAVNGGTFSDGGTFSGSITLDPASGNPTDWNVSVAGGGAFFPARTYTPANSGGSTQLFLGGTQLTIFLAASDEPNRQLRLTPVAPLDGSASNVNLDVAFVNG